MLKALEIIGFKSFADKTRFEFPRGITVVVGPNGSGKSNVVDAVKWVLGEQSVKSLRGKEMVDVIFNGSGSRRPMNSAEITLTLDNSARLLTIDTPEVHITRRVYRSGEGEYLINRQPSRLRDIRDLLAGTGLGTQAYSVIEQGKVDVLLQSSPRDRRMIFEEAAGISRFKAKKLEAVRRLERVEQNLLRLSDIVEEVENRLRTVRAQAGKARRYKEYTDRLQELRTQVGLVDWRKLTARLDALEAELAALSQERDTSAARGEALEARLLETETELQSLSESIRRSELEAASHRERIATAEASIEHERLRSRELEQEIARRRQQLAGLSTRAGGIETQLRQTSEEVLAAEEHHRQTARLVAEGERLLTEVLERSDRLRAEHHQRRAAQSEQNRSLAALESQIGRLESQAAAALATLERAESRAAEVRTQLDTAGHELREVDRDRTAQAEALQSLADRVAAGRGRWNDLRGQVAERQAELAALKQRESVLAERAAVLEEFEKRLEGLSPGVKQVLGMARQDTDGPWRHVCGLVADLIEVNIEAAPLVEVALGEAAEYLVIRSSEELVGFLEQGSPPFSGRVVFLRMETPTAQTPPDRDVDLSARPGVLGRADRLVSTPDEYAPLVRRLLGRTWFVEDLARAVALAAERPGLDFVTAAGQRWAADGTLAIGPRQVSTGLISRRSELRSLRAQLSDLAASAGRTQSLLAALQAEAVRAEDEVGRLTAEHERVSAVLAELTLRIMTAEERIRHLRTQQESLLAESRDAAAEHQSAEQSLAAAQTRHTQVQTAVAEIQDDLDRLTGLLNQVDADRQARHHHATDAKVELAKSEERLRNLVARRRQCEETQRDRQREIDENREQLAGLQQKLRHSQGVILAAEAEIAGLYLGKEACNRQTVEHAGRRDEILQARSGLAAEAQRIRGELRRMEERIHQADLSAGEVRHERAGLADRLREDYGIELAELDPAATAEEQRHRDEVQQEIEELRRKINNLGNVNLEALEELEQLDQRHTTLAAQFKDLSEAKSALARIIDKINTDSRRLFIDTLQTVKGHFGELFRDLFGGGRADIVLEENVDILESGIEIVARPPGKEPRSISLLSGGEKTMTCVALLLAIFRSRPSPFCVLDEVDAALDEANIDRFIKVLKDFLAWTQFIIVTHSKKTMTAADTIYGVTMQESGVSKQVSVRFEDVSDDGRILIPPNQPAAPPPAEEEEAA